MGPGSPLMFPRGSTGKSSLERGWILYEKARERVRQFSQDRGYPVIGKMHGYPLIYWSVCVCVCGGGGGGVEIGALALQGMNSYRVPISYTWVERLTIVDTMP